MSAENTDKRYANLSEAKRKLLLQRLHGKKASQSPDPTLKKRPANAARIASAGQRRIWLAEQMNASSAAYNITSCFKFHTPLDQDRLERALNKVLSRHEALRSVFAWEKDQLTYKCADRLELEVQREAAVRPHERAAFHAKTIFDLSEGPLLKFVLIESESGYGIVVLVIHHIVFDEWSLPVFWEELQKYYNSGAQLDEPQPDAQFYEFAHWQNEQLRQGSFDSQLDFWSRRLQGAPACLDLPLDDANHSSASNSGAIEKIGLDADTSEKLRQLARDEGVSVFSVLLAVFNILLYKYSSQSDIVVGTPIANRSKKEFSKTIGFFLNTAAIRSDLAGNPPARELIQNIQAAVLEALSNQDIPFDIVIERVKPERANGKPPLVQTMFVYQKGSEVAPIVTLDDQVLESTTTESSAAKLDLTLFAVESAGAIELFSEYKTELFERGTARRLLEHYCALATRLASNPNLPIEELDILSDEAKRALIEASQGPDIAIENRHALHHQISEYSKSHPSHIALESATETLTYLELEKRVASLAALLQDHGASGARPVAIFLPRSIDAIVAILAVLQSGSYYLVVDPSYPSSRNQLILSDSAPSHILTTPDLQSAVSSVSSIPLITSLSPSSSQLPKSADTSGLAYLIYTSGSTGRPKGVEITHSNLVYSTFARTHYYPKKPERFLLMSSLSFDSSVAGLFWTLSSGGTLVLPNQGDEKDPFKLCSTIARKEITTLLCIPSLYHEILKAQPGDLSSLETAIVAGEDCLPIVSETHFNTIPTCSLYNEYGPTEACVWATVDELHPQSRISIGEPIANYGTYILNEHRMLQPEQVPGELYISGPGLARGYHKNEKLTDERFVDIQLHVGAAVRMYRTGDRVRRTKSGTLEILGRVDRQIKIRGFRLELGDVEAELSQSLSVNEVVVLPIQRETEHGRHIQLVAYLGASDPSLVRIPELRIALGQSLPPHAIPSQFVVLPTLPKLPNGKVDRNALPSPGTNSYDKEKVVPPTTETEAKLVELWKTLLSVPSVSTTDSFFDLGGTSLQAIWLFSKIQDQFETRVSPSQLLRSPNIATLAKLIEDKAANSNLKNIVCLQQGSDLQPLFLMHAAGQELLFYKDLINRLDSRIPIYGIQPIGHDGTERPIEKMEEIIDRYTSEILSIQSTGPFHIVGHCQGGYFAMEVAKRLRSKNNSLGLICSIDGRAPRTNKTAAHSVSTRNSKLQDTIKRKFNGLKWRSKRAAIHLKYLYCIKYGTQRQKSDAIYRESFMAVSNAINRHVTIPFEPEILVFQCLDSAKYPSHSTEFWKQSAPNVEFIEFKCLHHEILEEPYVADTANAITQRYFEKG